MNSNTIESNELIMIVDIKKNKTAFEGVDQTDVHNGNVRV